MKKRKTAVLIFIAVICCCTGVYAAAAPQSAGVMPDSLRQTLHAEQSIRDGMGDRDDKVVGYVSEEPVYEKDFLISYERAKYTGAEDPCDAAVESVKQQILERKYAEENGICPSEEEILEYTKGQHDAVNADPDSKAYVAAYCEEAGMTEEEYWDVYKPSDDEKYLIHLAVINDIYEKTGKRELDISGADFVLTDPSFSGEEIEKTAEQVSDK